MPAGIPMAAPYTPDPAATATGPVGGALARIREALGGLEGWRVWVGAADSSAALARIFYEATYETGARWALIEHAGLSMEVVGYQNTIPRGRVVVRFYSPIGLGQRGRAGLSDAFIAFSNGVGPVGSALVNALIHIGVRMDGEPEFLRPEEVDRLTDDDWYEASYTFVWGLG